MTNQDNEQTMGTFQTTEASQAQEEALIAQEDDVTRMMVVDDHPVVRRGICDYLEMEDDFTIVAEASNGQDAVKLAIEHEPDLILLDLNMEGMSGIDTLIALRNADVFCKVVVFTVSEAEEDVLAALKAGADGYMIKDVEPDELVDSLRQSMKGRSVYSDRVMDLLVKAIRGKKEGTESKPAASPKLTEREIEILKQIAEGHSNKVVARKLSCSEGTVKVHVKNILKKLGLKSRVEAAVWAVEHPKLLC